MMYGYTRISTAKQSLQRQVDNLKKFNSDIEIYQEVFTGTQTDGREVYKRLKGKLKKGDVLVFDSVSRMSRNAEEGIQEYFELMERGIDLIFLKERYIDTAVYKDQIESNQTIKTNDTDLDQTIFKGIREYLERLAKKQIKIAFDQAEKEVKDLQERTKEALKIKKMQGVELGRKAGVQIETKKEKEMRVKIKKLSKDFDGNLKDVEVMELLKLARNTYYKYKKKLSQEN